MLGRAFVSGAVEPAHRFRASLEGADCLSDSAASRKKANFHGNPKTTLAQKGEPYSVCHAERQGNMTHCETKSGLIKNVKIKNSNDTDIRIISGPREAQSAPSRKKKKREREKSLS